MNFDFDLQLFGGGGNGGSQIGDATNYYSQLANQGSQEFNTAMPNIQSMIPILMNYMQGNLPSSMTEAAQAPVKAQMQNIMQTLGSHMGETTNPNALFQQLGLTGSTQAALASDNLIGPMASSSMSSLSNLLGGLVSQSGQSINSAAKGDANLGLNLSQQSNEFWGNLLSSVGQVFGMSNGGSGGSSPQWSSPSTDNSQISGWTPQGGGQSNPNSNDSNQQPNSGNLFGGPNNMSGGPYNSAPSSSTSSYGSLSS